MEEKSFIVEEKVINARSGWLVLFLDLLSYLVSVVLIVGGIYICEDLNKTALGATVILLGSALMVFAIIISRGFKIVKPNEAVVLTLFGKYTGSIKDDGFYHVNPFCSVMNPAYTSWLLNQASEALTEEKGNSRRQTSPTGNKNLSLKVATLKNEKQKINDELGNPIEIGVNVIWKIQNTAKAVFNVDNYTDFLSTQADSALRTIVRLYPYDVSDEGDEKSLRGSAQEVAEKIEEEFQKKVDVAGIEILEVRITHLAYAPEIAAAMLQRQ
ncbi:MAG: SPFH domain-containing protein, partial [Clostridiales bacterium]|nr:SPFH domain-containing protein [Clostridiales bacterium]